MKYTLADCITTINQVLNYPSVDYSDISHFFDHAISELNTELNIGLRPISEIYKNANFKIEDLGDVVILDKAPGQYVSTTEGDTVYYTISDGVVNIFYKKDADDEYTKTKNRLYGIYARFDGKEIIREVYQTVVLSGHVYWTPYEIMPTTELDLLEYLPMDWINLFLIPYVCFKYSSRSGTSSVLYVDEFTQGFQQLQKSYDVPCFVNLKENAGKIAYKQDLEERLPDIDVKIPTRAIYDSMKVGRTIRAEYGGMYDNGGWNL